MTPIDFAAAQQRVISRQQQRTAQARTRLEAQRDHRALSILSTLPYPLSILGERGLQTWDSIKGREGTRPAYRVGQVDAELLDEELLELLRGQVGEALKHFGIHIRDDWSAEILFILRAILFKLSIWDHDASYGATLQGLRYTDARKPGPLHTSLTLWQKSLYGLFSICGRYGWEKWESWLISQEEEATRNVRLLSRLSNLASAAHSAAAFASFLVFLVNGHYRTLLDRILRMRLVTPSHQISREVSFEYLNRQLVWHAFTEFLLFLLPLVGISRWRRWITRAWRRTKSITQTGTYAELISVAKGELAFLPERTCAICYKDQNPTSGSENEIIAVSGASGGIVGSAQTDITNPYETRPCGCLYCFVCIATRLEIEEGEGWVCLRCGELVKECKPWSGDVIERQHTSDANSVSFSREDVSLKSVGGMDEPETNGTGSQDESGSPIGELKSGWAQEGSDSAIDITSD